MEHNTILLLGAHSSTFILSKIKDALLAGNHDVQQLEASVTAISALDPVPDLVILYASDFDIDLNREVLIYLKDYCIEHERKIGVIGQPDEIEGMEEIFTRSLIWKSYVRPLNIKDFASDVDEKLALLSTVDDKKKVLVVDDSASMLALAKSWLSDKYNVTTAGSAATALAMVAQNKPDLILLDYEMPVCNGPKFLEMLHSELSTSNIPVIFLTSMSDRESVKAVLGLKPDGYLLKTMEPDKIISAVDDFFEKRKML